MPDRIHDDKKDKKEDQKKPENNSANKKIRLKSFAPGNPSGEDQHQNYTPNYHSDYNIAVDNYTRYLQDTIGNQAVISMYKSGELQAKSAELYINHLNSVLGPMSVSRMYYTGELQQIIQAKFDVDIGLPDDKYEKEADEIADKVVNNKTEINQPNEHTTIKITRKEISHTDINLDNTASGMVNRTVSKQGKPLPVNTKNFFESRFNHDFSDVRIYDDYEAAASADIINAKAYTIGNNIVFRKNEYKPDSPGGKKLIAHELVHTVQQKSNLNSSNNTIQRKTSVNYQYGYGSVNPETFKNGALNKIKKDDPDFWNNIYSKGLKGAALVLEWMPADSFIPILPPGLFMFLKNFLKGIMVGAMNRLSEEKIENLWYIAKNTAKAVASFEFMKAFGLGFLHGFAGDFLTIIQMPGMIKNIIEFVKNSIRNIKKVHNIDLGMFEERLLELSNSIKEGGKGYIKELLADLKAGKPSPLLIDTLKILLNAPQTMGKGIGGSLAGQFLKYFSQDYKNLGKDLGSKYGEAFGTVAFEVLLDSIAAGTGKVFGTIKKVLDNISDIIKGFVGKVVSKIGDFFKLLGSKIGEFGKTVKNFFLGFGESVLFKKVKGKVSDIIQKFRKIIDNIVEILSGKKRVYAKAYNASNIIGSIDDKFLNLTTTQKIEKAFEEITKVFGKSYSDKIRELYDLTSHNFFKSYNDLGIFDITKKGQPVISINTNIGNAKLMANTILHEVRHLRHYKKLKVKPSIWKKMDIAFLESFATATNITQGKKLGLTESDLKLFIEYYNYFRGIK